MKTNAELVGWASCGGCQLGHLALGKCSGDVWIPTGNPLIRHDFEVISQALNPELEAVYDMIFLINTAEGPTPLGAFLPNQHMLVVQRMLLKRSSSLEMAGD